MTNHRCVVRPPAAAPGKKLTTGLFLRNLEHKQAKQFKPNEERPPLHGWRLSPHNWGWNVQGNEGLSVNFEPCIGCSHCSIMSHPKPSQFRHVVRVDLERLSALVQREVVAEYSPTPPTPDAAANLCHFDLLNPTGPIDDIIQQLRVIDAKLKDVKEHGPRAELRALYMATFDLRFDVHAATTETKNTPPDGHTIGTESSPRPLAEI